MCDGTVTRFRDKLVHSDAYSLGNQGKNGFHYALENAQPRINVGVGLKVVISMEAESVRFIGLN